MKRKSFFKKALMPVVAALFFTIAVTGCSNNNTGDKTTTDSSKMQTTDTTTMKTTQTMQMKDTPTKVDDTAHKSDQTPPPKN